MKDDNYFTEQRANSLDLGELDDIVDDLRAESIQIYYESGNITTMRAICKGEINAHIMFKMQKLYNLDVFSIRPIDEESIQVMMSYSGKYKNKVKK